MTLLALTTLILLTTSVAARGARGHNHADDPITLAAKRWKPDRAWLRGAFCIWRHESVDWHRAYVDWRGRPSPYSGGLQFLHSTWVRAGGKGHAWQWAPREQLFRAWRIWRENGGSWVEWGTRGACGLS